MKLRVLINNSIFFLALLLTLSNCYSQDEISISYIGNMGVLIGDEGNSVLIDGFHKEYGPQYIFPPDSVVNKIINGQYDRYNTIDIAIASHRHGDHFDADYFLDFLKLNTESKALISPQIKELIIEKNKGNNTNMSTRIKTSVYDGNVGTFKKKGIVVEAFRCDHANSARHKSVENTAYVITIENTSLIHLGDTNWDVAKNHLIKHSNILQNIDVAVIPYWMLLEEKSKSLVKQLINPRYLIATHIPPNLEKKQAKNLSVNFPGIILFMEIGQKLHVTERP